MLITETNNAHQASSNNGEAKIVSSAKKKSIDFSFLKKTRLRKLTNWNFGYLNQNQVLFSDKYPLAKIGTFLTRCKNAVKIQDSEFYKQVTIKLYGKGAKLRDDVLLSGKEIKTKSQFLVREGQFLLSRIDARNGAFAIATKEIDGAIVTNDFPVYDIDQNLINPNYFALLISTQRFASYFQGLSSGTTNRQRVNEDDFLNIEIPLPPIDSEDKKAITQKKLVADYNAKILQAEDFEEKAKDLEKQIETYLLKELGIKIQQTERKDWQGFKFLQSANLKGLSRWNVDFLLNLGNAENSFTSKYKTIRFGEISKGIGGGTPSKNVAEFWKGEIPWVSPKDMKTDFLTQTQDYISEVAIKKSSAPLLESGYLIFVMRSGILQHTVPVAINQISVSINQDLRAYKIINKDLDSEFLLRYFQNIQKILLKLVKTGTTVQSIDSKRLEDLRIPIPPRKVQTKIVEHINSLKAQIKDLKSEAEDLRIKAKNDFESELFET